uniref:Uncharacterized protein n=1 Tax=Setaria viridis TaxID=4556 RepID=A0A4U6W170_SETVI|nr:hypothetical protein SEVIR_2G363450v2 [Setaria viridis]
MRGFACALLLLVSCGLETMPEAGIYMGSAVAACLFRGVGL